MTPRSLFLAGATALVAALALAAAGAGFPGPLNPECSLLAGRCLDAAHLAGYALQVLALGVGLLGAILIGIGLGRIADRDDPRE